MTQDDIRDMAAEQAALTIARLTYGRDRRQHAERIDTILSHMRDLLRGMRDATWADAAGVFDAMEASKAASAMRSCHAVANALDVPSNRSLVAAAVKMAGIAKILRSTEAGEVTGDEWKQELAATSTAA